MCTKHTAAVPSLSQSSSSEEINLLKVFSNKGNYKDPCFPAKVKNLSLSHAGYRCADKAPSPPPTVIWENNIKAKVQVVYTFLCATLWQCTAEPEIGIPGVMTARRGFSVGLFNVRTHWICYRIVTSDRNPYSSIWVCVNYPTALSTEWDDQEDA